MTMESRLPGSSASSLFSRWSQLSGPAGVGPSTSRLHMKVFPGVSPILGLLALGMAIPTARADPSGSPGADKANQYPVPYEKPSVDSITAVMLRVLSHVDAAGKPTLVDGSTRQEVTDLTKPVQRAS